MIVNCDLRTFQNFPKLKLLQNLNVSKNSLRGSFQFLVKNRNIKYIDVSHNIINDIKKFQPLRCLKNVSVYAKQNPFISKNGQVEGKNSVRQQLKHFGIKLLQKPIQLKKVVKIQKVQKVESNQVREEITKKEDIFESEMKWKKYLKAADKIRSKEFMNGIFWQQQQSYKYRPITSCMKQIFTEGFFSFEQINDIKNYPYQRFTENSSIYFERDERQKQIVTLRDKLRQKLKQRQIDKCKKKQKFLSNTSKEKRKKKLSSKELSREKEKQKEKSKEMQKSKSKEKSISKSKSKQKDKLRDRQKNTNVIERRNSKDQSLQSQSLTFNKILQNSQHLLQNSLQQYSVQQFLQRSKNEKDENNEDDNSISSSDSQIPILPTTITCKYENNNQQDLEIQFQRDQSVNKIISDNYHYQDNFQEFHSMLFQSEDRDRDGQEDL